MRAAGKQPRPQVVLPARFPYGARERDIKEHGALGLSLMPPPTLVGTADGKRNPRGAGARNPRIK